MTKKDSILLAALKLLTTNGVHATPMSAIAKEAGTGMGTIYNYFPSKEILINKIYVSIKQKEKNLFEPISKDDPIKTQFEKYYKTAIQFYVVNPMFFQFMEQLQASPIITEDSRKAGRKAASAFIQLVEKGKQDRIIKNISIKELMRFIGGCVLSYTRWYFHEKATERAPLDHQLQMVWDAIKE